MAIFHPKSRIEWKMDHEMEAGIMQGVYGDSVPKSSYVVPFGFASVLGYGILKCNPNSDCIGHRRFWVRIWLPSCGSKSGGAICEVSDIRARGLRLYGFVFDPRGRGPLAISWVISKDEYGYKFQKLYL